MAHGNYDVQLCAVNNDATDASVCESIRVQLRMSIAIAVCILVMWFICGCARRERIIARVDGDVITEDEFMSELMRRAGKRVLRELVTERLIRREAIKRGVRVTPDEVKREIKRRRGSMSEGDFKRMLQNSDMTMQDFERKVELELLTRKICMADPEAVPTSREVIEYYRSHREEFNIPERVRLRDIMVMDKQSAQHIWRALQEKGSDFAGLARALSQDPATRQRGGDMGTLPVDSLAPKMREVVKELDVGEISKPFEMDGEWYIIKLEQRLPKRERSFDEVRAFISKLLRERKATALQATLPGRLWKGANVKVYDSRLRPLTPP